MAGGVIEAPSMGQRKWQAWAGRRGSRGTGWRSARTKLFSYLSVTIQGLDTCLPWGTTKAQPEQSSQLDHPPCYLQQGARSVETAQVKSQETGHGAASGEP